MSTDLQLAVKKARALVECDDPVEALSVIHAALRLRPGKHVKIALWNARDGIKRGEFDRAVTYLDSILTTENVRRVENNFSLPVHAVAMRVIYYTIRGVAKVKKDGGTFKMPSDPGDVQHVLFMRHGEPTALAICAGVQKKLGEWRVTYEKVLWLTENQKHGKN